MKYVRTKDGVFKVGDRETDICILTNHGYIYKQDILNQADTIEELCDTFVNETENSILDKFFFYQKNEDCFVSEHDLTLIFERDSVGTRLLKGATFTDKGLIYVAKMNEKGELELL